MLTPSNVTVAAFNAAVKNDAPSHIRMTFTGQNIILEDEDIEMNGLTLQTLLNADTDLTFGRAVMSSLTVHLINSSKLNNINWNGEFKLEIGVEVNGSTEYITLGYFTGSRPEKVTNVDVISFTANDRMQKFDILADEWLASLTFPTNVWQMYNNLISYIGLNVQAGDEASNIKNKYLSSAPIVNKGLSCRDVLSLFAEAFGCYATISPNGDVLMKWYTNHTEYALTGDDVFSSDGFDVPLSEVGDITGINGISVKQTEDDIGIEVPAGATGNVYAIIDNPILMTRDTSETRTFIGELYTRLTTFGGYLPCSVQCIGNPLVEAGDIITAYVNGQNVRMPIFVRNLHWNGHCTDSYEATGNMKREYVRTSERQKLVQGYKYHIFRNDIDTLDSEIGDAQGNISQLQQDVGGLSTRVQSAEGNISSVQQQANRIDATVSQKTRVFYGSTTPTGTTADPVISGDLWVDTGHNNAMKRYNGSSWVDASYDDPDIATISLAVQKKARIYYSSTAPTGSTSDPLVTGDLWIDTANDKQLKRYNGSSWVDASFDDPDKYTVQSGIDITANGIDVTGSKYVKIRSGGSFDVDSTNFKISSADKNMKIGNWTFNENGVGLLVQSTTSQGTEQYALKFGSYLLSSDIHSSGFVSGSSYNISGVSTSLTEMMIGLTKDHPRSIHAELAFRFGLCYGKSSLGNYEDLLITPTNTYLNLDCDLGSSGSQFYTMFSKHYRGDGVKNNLTTTDDGYVLDARQGKVLDEKITTKANQLILDNSDTLATIKSKFDSLPITTPISIYVTVNAMEILTGNNLTGNSFKGIVAKQSTATWDFTGLWGSGVNGHSLNFRVSSLTSSSAGTFTLKDDIDNLNNKLSFYQIRASSMSDFTNKIDAIMTDRGFYTAYVSNTDAALIGLNGAVHFLQIMAFNASNILVVAYRLNGQEIRIISKGNGTWKTSWTTYNSAS